MAQQTEQVEGATDYVSIRTWCQSNNITLSEDAINKLEQNGFITIEDLQYCTPNEMDKDAKEEMNIKLADRKKLKKAMQILTKADSNVMIPSNVITMMGHTFDTKYSNDTKNTIEIVSDDIVNVKEGITLMGHTENVNPIEIYKNENLYIGNLHKLSARTHLYSEEKTAHEWTMFVSTSKNRLLKSESIKQVTFFLHRTFNPTKITVKEPPFKLKRTGWGFFMIKAKIEFYDKYNRENIFCAHELNFNYNVTVTHIDENNSVSAEKDDKKVNDMGCYSFYNESDVEISYSNEYIRFDEK